MNSKYIVVHFWSSSGEAPLGNGSTVIYCGDDLAEAKTVLAVEVADYWADGGIPTDDWKPGYQSDPESLKWSESAYLGDYTAAWVTHGDNFEKCEILEFKDELKRWRPL